MELSDVYNGQTTERYSWSQNISELDVTVPVPTNILKGKQVKVEIQSNKVFVSIDGDALVDGTLAFQVKKEDCYWNLVPGECVRIFLQKSQERWWQKLIEGEPELEMSKINAEKSFDELPEEESMKLQELCWNEERKRNGLPTSEDMKMRAMLEKAWDADGSPFKGTPVDLSKIQYNQNPEFEG